MSTTTTSATRAKKVKALLAGGLVLGVGAAVTLASWSDQAYVNATFGTSEFNIEVNAESGDVWEEAETEGAPSTLNFSMSFVDELQPGNTVYAPLSLRTAASSVGGTVTLNAATSPEAGTEGLFDALTYTVANVSEGETCSAEGIVDTPAIVDAGSSLGTPSDAGALTLPAAMADDGTSTDLCFAVTLPAEADDPDLQGQTTTALWEFSAESDDN